MSTALAIVNDQNDFSPAQRTALVHMGVAPDVDEADLKIFMHRCQATGLDPFSGQIHMIGRKSKNYDTGQYEMKYTIQTGIDGYRVIGHRAADERRVPVAIKPAEWMHEDGSWRPVWSKKWGQPLAARVTIVRGTSEFTGTAMFDEYVQTKRDGSPNQMWSQRPAGQLAKCAEALAWRMAFPQDMQGIYTDEEMGQADNRHQVESRGPAPAFTEPQAHQQAASSSDPIGDRTRGHLFALFTQKGIPEDQQLAGINYRLGTQYESRKQLTEDDGQALISYLSGLPDAVDENVEDAEEVTE